VKFLVDVLAIQIGSLVLLWVAGIEFPCWLADLIHDHGKRRAGAA